MTNPDLTLIGVLVDRSGSMVSIKSSMEEALAGFLTDQASQPGQAQVSLSQFDTEYDNVYSLVDIKDVPKYHLAPRWGTALWDGMGRFITETGQELAGRDEDKRPETVLIVVITDGEENSSRIWTLSRLRELIAEQKDKYNWQFVFLGANIDSQKVGADLGLDADSVMDFDASPVAVASAGASLSNYSTSLRAMGVASFSSTDRQAAMGAQNISRKGK